MADAKITKRGATSPWRWDSQSIFGRAAPTTPWQMQGHGIDDLGGGIEDEDSPDDDADVRIALKQLRKKGDARDVFKVSPSARDRAREVWMDSRAQHQRTLWESRAESVSPSQQTVAPLIDPTAPMCEDDDPEFLAAINAALTGRVRNNPNYQRAVRVEPTRDDLRQYVIWHKGDVVEALWVEQGSEAGGIAALSYRMIVAALMTSSRRTDQVHGLRLLDASQESELGDNHAKWVFEYSSKQKKRILVRAEGPWAWEIGLAWLETQGEIPKDTLEKDYLASVWGTRVRTTGTKKDEKSQLAEVVLWADVMGRIRTEGSQFFGRLIQLPHQDFDHKDKLFVVDKKEYGGQERSRGLNILDEAKMANASSSAAKLRLRWAVRGAEWIVAEAKGENINEAVDSWIESRGINTTTIIIRSLIAGMLGMRVSLKPGEVASKEDLRQELFRPGGLQQLLDVRAKMNPDFDPNASHVTVVVGFRGNEYYGLQVLSDKEMETASLPKTSAKIQFEKQEGGHKIVKAEGLRHQSFLGGQVFAPDADAIGRVNEAVRQLTTSPSGFGDAEVMSKPEPLFTPADVMPMPQLERPATAPKVETTVPGFHILSPDEIDATKLLPSDTIPVITGPSEETVEEIGVAAGIAAMIMGVVACLSGACMIRMPAFGSGGIFLSPRNSHYPDGA